MTPIARSPLRHRVDALNDALRALRNLAFSVAVAVLFVYIVTSPLVLAVVLFRLSVGGCR